MDTTRLVFVFKGLPVGAFEGSEYPKRKGLYRYLPFRGPGHLQMHLERLETGSARCSYKVGSKQVAFVVLDCPEYGLLELADFEFEEDDAKC